MSDKHKANRKPRLARGKARVYKKAMARCASATVPLSAEDLRALARAEAVGLAPADLLRKGLRLAAAAYYQSGRRSPKTRLFISTDPQLGEESHLFEDLEAD